MHKVGGLFVEKANRLFQTLDQRYGNAASPSAVPDDLGNVKQLHLAGSDDGSGGRLRDQAHTGLGARQRCFKAKHRAQKVALAERVQNFRGGEKTFKYAAHALCKSSVIQCAGALLSRIWLGNGTDRRNTSSPSHKAERQARCATVGSGICW